MQLSESAMLSQLMEPMDGGVLSRLAPHIFKLMCYCEVHEAARSFSCSKASHNEHVHSARAPT